MAWTIPRTWVVGELVTAALLNTHIRDNQTYVKTEVDRIDDCSESDIIGSRAVDTAYQNGTKIRIAVITVEIDNGEKATFRSGPVTPGITVAAIDNGSAGDTWILPTTIVIAPSHFYRVDTTSGAPSLVDWIEWDLH